MKRIIIALIGIVSLAGVLSDVVWAMEGNQDCGSTNLNFIGAKKTLSDDWGPVNDQDELGANIDLRGAYWPVSLDIWYLYATQEGSANEILTTGNITTAYDNLQREATTEELSLGIKKIWTGGESGVSLFLSGGAAWIRGSLAFTNVATFDESQVGWYGAAGVYYTMLHFINVGVFGRYSDVRLNLAGTDLNAGGWHYGVMAGFHF